ncbi:MAG: hypothetical protein KatS3mg110_1683 [Pirellulaceae bacterium]|nr:MAG: hypothetical protein KatS3mg110_1683 [Pirellulaceae bacterium]
MASEQIQLRCNRRAVAAAGILPLLLAALGVVFCVIGRSWWLWAAGTFLVGLALLVLVSLVVVWRTPLLVLDDRMLVVRMNWAVPEKIPIECVECFFLGEGQTELPASAGRTAKTRTVVVRLAEAARAHQERPVPHWLGRWKDGYITINGAWCEPITCQLLTAFNERLREVQRRRRTESTACIDPTQATDCPSGAP